LPDTIDQRASAICFPTIGQRIQRRKSSNSQFAAREPCEQSPQSHSETARPETLGIEAQTVDTQGTGFNSSETLKEQKCLSGTAKAQKFMCEHTGEACKIKVFHYPCYKCLGPFEFSSSLVPGCNEDQQHSAQSEGHCKKASLTIDVSPLIVSISIFSGMCRMCRMLSRR
jgi:hypothetical protein